MSSIGRPGGKFIYNFAIRAEEGRWETEISRCTKSLKSVAYMFQFFANFSSKNLYTKICYSFVKRENRVSTANYDFSQEPSGLSIDKP